MSSYVDRSTLVEQSRRNVRRTRRVRSTKFSYCEEVEARMRKWKFLFLLLRRKIIIVSQQNCVLKIRCKIPVIEC